MAGIDHRCSLVAQALDARENGIATLRIHGDRGLIEEDELGLMGDAAGDVKAAQQATRELLRAEPHVISEVDELDRLVYQRPAAGAVSHVERAEEVDVLAHGELLEHRDLLRHHADAPLEVVARGRHGLPEELDGAAVVGEKLQHAVDGRGLAAAVGAEQAEYLALFDGQIEVVERKQISVALDEAGNTNDIHRLLLVVG